MRTMSSRGIDGSVGDGSTMQNSVSPAPVVVTPVAHRAQRIYDALISYHWAWVNVGSKAAPQVVDFSWNGHVSGGWTWEMVYKPDGETLVDCNWGGNGHEYLRMNEACDGFNAVMPEGEDAPARLEPFDLLRAAMLRGKFHTLRLPADAQALAPFVALFRAAYPIDQNFRASSLAVTEWLRLSQECPEETRAAFQTAMAAG